MSSQICNSLFSILWIILSTRQKIEHGYLQFIVLYTVISMKSHEHKCEQNGTTGFLSKFMS